MPVPPTCPAVPRELCLFPTLRELDMDGGHLSGPWPTFLQECFPELEELDLSYNRVSATSQACEHSHAAGFEQWWANKILCDRCCVHI
jgi:hypothetical protein